MDVRIAVETTFDNGKKRSHYPGHFSRPFRQAQPECVGLLLKDARTLLRQLQEAMLLRANR